MNYDQTVIEAKQKLNELVTEDWKEDLFTSRWWVLVVFIVIFYVVFFLLFKKNRATKILLFGALMSVASFFFDGLGSEKGYWTYLVRIFPLVPSPFIYSLTVVPISFMYAYQYSHSWGKFLILSVIVSCLISLIFFPVLSAIQVYKLTNWNYLYFIPVLFASSVVARLLTEWMIGLEQKNMKYS